MIKSKKQMYIIMGAFILVLMLFTTTYAFFNYTRTGSRNTIRTGRIAFNSTQGNAINLTNIFPIDVTNGIPNDATKVGTVTINVTGDTTYADGLEYLVTATNVSNTVGNKSLPISIDVSVANNTNNDPATTLGTADASYFTNRGGNTSIYKVLANETINTDDQLLVGYIAPGATGVDGNIVIRAYLDKAKIAITDTYPEGTVHTVKTAGYSSSNCEAALTGVQDANTYCATASDLQDAIDGEDLTSAQITMLVNAGIVEEYNDGTTSEWIGDRIVFTTSEWNSLQQDGVSFQVKVESNEGTWVEEPIHPICRRAESLHSVKCESESPYGCESAIGLNNMITYGNLGTQGDELHHGDALDCDVNNDGEYNPNTERFYYVTSHGDGANTTAVLIYYTSISNDGTTIAASDSSKYEYATQEDINALGYNVESADNLHGPATAYKQLPSISQWSNNQILMVSNESARTRQITDENLQTVTSFTYTGKAARFLTLSEVKETCEKELIVNPSAPTGDLDSCQYLLENVKAYERENSSNGYYLENSYSINSNYFISVNGNGRAITVSGGGYSLSSTVRPVIEVLKSNIAN